MAEIKLYRRDQPFWLVDATCEPNTGLLTISGNADAEWHTKVTPQHLDPLLAALRRGLRTSPDEESGVSREQEILDLLLMKKNL